MRLVCYRGNGKQPWRWRLVATNGRIVADSAEGYATKSNLRRAVTRLQAARIPRWPVVWK